MTMTHRMMIVALALPLITWTTVVGATAQGVEPTDRYLAYVNTNEVEVGNGWFERELRKFRTYPRLDRAYRLIDADRLPDAQEELERAINGNPDDLQVRLVYLGLLTRLANHAAVVQQANEVLKHRAGFVPALMYRGSAWQALASPAEAIQDFITVSDSPDTLEADRVAALSMVADLSIKGGKYEQAMAALDRVARVKNSMALCFRRGMALERLGRLVEAEQAYRLALPLASSRAHRADAYRAIGNVAIKSGDVAYARTAFTTAAGLDPNDAALRGVLGRLAYDQLDYTASVDWLGQALQLRPDREERELRAAALHALKRYASEIQELQTLLREIKTRADRHRVLVALGWAYENNAELVHAEQAFRQAVQLQPDITTMRSLADLLRRQGKDEQARAYLAEAVRQRPTPAWQRELGDWFIAGGDPHQAIAYLEPAARDESDAAIKGTTHRRLGYLYYEIGRFGDARTSFEAALSMLGEDPALLSALGETCVRLSAVNDAVGFFRRALNVKDTSAVRASLAATLAVSGRTDEALTAYREMLTQNHESTDTADLLLKIGSLESVRGNHVSASDAFMEALSKGASPDFATLSQASASLIAAHRAKEAIDLDRRILTLPEAVPEQVRGEILVRLGYAYGALQQHGEAANAFRDAITHGRDDWQVRQALGITLYLSREWTAALQQLRISIQQSPAARTLVYLANCYQQLGKPGLAVHYMQQALEETRPLDPGEKATVLKDLGFLYIAEAEYERAAAAWTQSLTWNDDAPVAVRLAAVDRLLGRYAEARAALERVDPARLPEDVRIERLEELARVHGQLGDVQAAAARWIEVIALSPTATRYFELGMAYQRLARPAEAASQVALAVAADPDNLEYTRSLAYLYKAIGREREATTLFAQLAEREPNQPAVFEELAYAHLRRSDTSGAVNWFKRSLDARAAHRLQHPGDAEASEPKMTQLRNEVARLSRHYDFTMYLASAAEGPTADARSPTGAGTLPSGQGGMELSYQPPKIGNRNERLFQMFARLLWNASGAPLAFESESAQTGIGVRYKPFGSQALFFSGERLLALGQNDAGRWLFRSSYSWNHGLEVVPSRRAWNYTTLYGDIAYFSGGGDNRLNYLEARQGRTISIAAAALVSPHVMMQSRVGGLERPGQAYVQAGPGLSLKMFIDRRRSGTQRSLELLVHYKLESWPANTGGGSATDLLDDRAVSNRAQKGWSWVGLFRF
jgi:adsorption protein A